MTAHWSCRFCARELGKPPDPPWKRCATCSGSEAATLADADAHIRTIRERLDKDALTHDDVAFGVDPAFEKLREAVDQLDDAVYNLIGLRSCSACRRSSGMAWSNSRQAFACADCEGAEVEASQ